MSDISVGAVGAAIIAGFISLLGLIIGKEQKVSEFRQAWIDELRKSMISYIANINSISDLLRMKKNGDTNDNSNLVSNYKALNEASLGIKLRVNHNEEPARALLKAMDDFENLASTNSSLVPDRIKIIERDFLAASGVLLKFEWNRVKRGEKIFVAIKQIIIALIAMLIVGMVYMIVFAHSKPHSYQKTEPKIELL